MEQNNKSSMSKLAILILAMLIIGSIFVINGINSYKNKLFSITYTEVISKIENGIIAYNANESGFFYSPLYSNSEHKDYSAITKKFLSEYIGIRKDCGSSNGDCFAKKYKNENKKLYIPKYKGACAILKNGTSICIMPQIKDVGIYGIMDLNGKNSPNILGKDLRAFKISSQKRGYNPDNETAGEINIAQP